MSASNYCMGQRYRVQGIIALLLIGVWSERASEHLRAQQLPILAQQKSENKQTAGKKGTGGAKGIKHGFIHHDFQGSKYQVFVPKSYDGKKSVPTILFLHGTGECGTDGDKQTHIGLGKAIHLHLTEKKDFPFLTVFPQAQHRSWDAKSVDGQRAMAILAEVERHYKVDPSHIYLTGLSLGGHGTWSLAAAYPQKWAAIVPVSGHGLAHGEIDAWTGKRTKTDSNSDRDIIDMVAVERIKNIPCWVFHSKADEGVLFHHSQDMVRALEKVGAKPKTHWFDRLSHEQTFDHVYIDTKHLYDWMLNHKR